MSKSRPTARAIIIQNNNIALLERHRQGRHYFVFPGGGVDPGETPQEAAIREALEETGLEIALDRLVAEVTWKGNRQFFFLAHPVGGKLGTGTGPEFTTPPSNRKGTYNSCWIALDEVLALPVLPTSIARLVQNHPRWPQNILYIDES